MEAWDALDGAEVVGLKVDKASKYQLIRRISAENMAKGNYILADFGCVPSDDSFITKAERYLKKYPKLGMIVSRGGGVAVCRKGVVDKWLPNETGTYVTEHENAYKLKGYVVANKRDLGYRRIDERVN
jgi:hypothetical protein